MYAFKYFITFFVKKKPIFKSTFNLPSSIKAPVNEQLQTIW